MPLSQPPRVSRAPGARGRLRSALVLLSGAATLVVLGADRVGLGKPGIGRAQGALGLAAFAVFLASLAGGRFTRLYARGALLLMNTVVAFLALNLVLLIVYHVLDHRPRRADPVSEKYGARLATVYPGMPAADVIELLRVWNEPFVYEPYTQFRMRPYASRFVNVSEHGFRQSAGPEPWPPDPGAQNVFVFGGSTTFCYGLPDAETVVAHMGALLRARGGAPVHVYNFGRGLYYSTQEAVLFERLLAAGARPDVAVFIDGLNEFRARDEPSFTPELEHLMAGQYPARPWPVLEEWPIRRLVADLVRARGQEGAAATAQPTSDAGTDSMTNAPMDPGAAIDRYLHNVRVIKAVARDFGVEPVFVWQPVPAWDYDLSEHLAPPDEVYRLGAFAGYPVMAERVKTRSPDERFVWCAAIQEGRHGPYYVDIVHYASPLARLLAQCVVDGMERTGALPPPDAVRLTPPVAAATPPSR